MLEEKEKGPLSKESLHSPSPQQCVQWCQRHPPAVCLLLMLDPTAVKRFSISNISVDVSLHLYCDPFHGHGQIFCQGLKSNRLCWRVLLPATLGTGDLAMHSSFLATVLRALPLRQIRLRVIPIWLISQRFQQRRLQKWIPHSLSG